MASTTSQTWHLTSCGLSRRQQRFLLPDFGSPEGWSKAENASDAESKYVVGEFNCSCVGLSKCLPAVCTDDSPSACWGDIPASDVKEAMRISDKMGNTVLSLLYWHDQCLAQPTGEAAVFEC